MESKLVVAVCMGSSCYLRGNKENLIIVQDYIEKNNLQCYVLLKGELCQNKCTKGPIIEIQNKSYSGVQPETIVDLLDRHLKMRDDCHE